MAIIGSECLFLVLALIDENLIALQYNAWVRRMVYPCMYIHNAAIGIRGVTYWSNKIMLVMNVLWRERLVDLL